MTTVNNLRLIRFRNHFDSSFETHGADVVLLIGSNGAGKTSVLEALHLLSTGVGMRTRRDRELVRFGEEGYRIEASGSPRFALALKYVGGSRTVMIDGATAKISDLIGRLRTTLFRPEDIRLIEEGPDERRRFLDIMISQRDRTYFEAFKRYRRASSQRRQVDFGRSYQGVRRSFSKLMLEEMPVLFATRLRTVRELDETINKLREQLELPGVIELEYRPAIPKGETEQDWAAASRAAIEHGERIEASGAPSPYGPLRDEVIIRWDGVEMRKYGSQGQKRLISLLLRMSEARWLTTEDNKPLLLVDDVFGELDEERSRLFLELLSGHGGQIWLAATSSTPYEEHWRRGIKFDIVMGSVQGEETI